MKKLSRLEEIKVGMEELILENQLVNAKQVRSDFQYLIKRVEELEKELQRDVVEEWGLMKQNQCYKQALEFYASRTEWQEGDIYLDGGEIARQAIRSESE